jgi:hypothetical protein
VHQTLRIGTWSWTFPASGKANSIKDQFLIIEFGGESSQDGQEEKFQEEGR